MNELSQLSLARARGRAARAKLSQMSLAGVSTEFKRTIPLYTTVSPFPARKGHPRQFRGGGACGSREDRRMTHDDARRAVEAVQAGRRG